MILTPIKTLKDFMYNYNRDIMLLKCIVQPLTPGLEKFVEWKVGSVLYFEWDSYYHEK